MNDDPERLSGLNAATQPRTLNRSYSKLVRRLRLILPMIAVAIIAALFTLLSFDDAGTIIEQPSMEKHRETAQNELLNPNFESTDDKGRPYSVTAARATQDDHDDKLVLLEAPSGTLNLKGDDKIALNALQGRYHQDRKTLMLSGDVTLVYNTAYVIRSTVMQVDLNRSLAWSEDRVDGEGPLGRVEATGFQADAAADHLILTGPAKLTIKREAL